ncbi:CocE/NonD family hydrolase [Gordonia crocea]|uniref:Xaa-Pro dipeptidyl-peptidase C-terminal domain-containing protein n=1 Tax=Gordonia crocea TaxID=589162 RepID=A0A7M3SU88_9ACTN|nr:CocE/NonD family hydrolase [Gordonia crocea]GED96212.1 hypothetical protein nbrc107697_02510 [Gordonia crocea]
MYVPQRGRRRASLPMALVVGVAAILGVTLVTVPANAAPQAEFLGRVPHANWYGAYIPVAGGAQIYADVLVPRERSGKVPVVLAVGPYFQHLRASRQRLAERVPAQRYDDLVKGARLLERGYAVVFADLRGFANSSGCPDNSGPADRSDIRRIVRWAASQSWSSGKVGLYGKSYDGVTGLMAAGERIPGLAAVVAQEPVYDWYRYLYGNGVPRTTRVGTPLSLVYTSMNPPPSNVDVSSRQFQDYLTRSAANVINPGCVPAALVATQSAGVNDPYWVSRRVLGRLRGSTVPLFLSQGFIDQNTPADGLVDLLRNVSGPVTGWLGMWDHVRGNDTDRSAMMGHATDRSSTGRTDYLDQVAAFYGHYLKGEGPRPTGFYVQDNTGSWRVQNQWPLRSSVRRVALTTGAYRFNGQQVATKVPFRNRWASTQIDGAAASFGVLQRTFDDAANGVWTLLPPEAAAIRISGAPRITLRTRLAGGHNPGTTPVAVDLYDVAPSGQAILISQNVSMLGPKTTSFRLFATDWVVAPGHRLAIRVTDSNRGRWDYYAVPPNAVTVNVVGGEALLPLAPVVSGTRTTGTSNTSLEGHLRWYRYPVPRR